MLQSPEPKYTPNAAPTNSYTPAKPATSPLDQANTGPPPVIMGKVQGNVECADRLDIRSEGLLSGDVITHRISVEEGAILKGGVEVRNPEKKDQKTQAQSQSKQEAAKAMAATAGSA